MEESLNGKVGEIEFGKLNDYVLSITKLMTTQKEELDKKTKQVEREMYSKNSELSNQIVHLEALIKQLQNDLGKGSSES